MQREPPRGKPLPEREDKAQEREGSKDDGGVHLLKDDRKSKVEAGRLFGFRMLVENKHAVWRKVIITGEGFARKVIVHRFEKLDANG